MIYKLFKNILFNVVQTDGKGEINIYDNITNLKLYFETISVEVKSKLFLLLIPKLCFTIKNVK